MTKPTTVFYEKATMQVMAVYEGCTYGGQYWQDQGFLEAPVKPGVVVSRDHKITLGDVETGKDEKGKAVFTQMVVKTQKSVNPIQPERPAYQPTDAEVIVEAARAAGITLDLDLARQRLTKSAKVS